MVVSYRYSNLQERHAVKIAISAIVATALYGLISNVLIPVATNSQQYIGLGMFSLDIFSLGLAVSILRYHFLDIKVYSWSAAAYLSGLFIVTLLFVTPLIIIVLHLLHHSLTITQFIGVAILSGLLLALLQYLHRLFNNLTARVFFRQPYDPQDVLDELSNLLVHTANMQTIRQETAAIISETLRADLCEYALFADQVKRDAELARKIDVYSSMSGLNSIDTNNIYGTEPASLVNALKTRGVALAVKLRTTHEDLGYMLLGYKQSGEAYSERDQRLLSVAADEIAISLQNALRFEEIQNFNVRLQQEVDEKTRELRRKNQRLIELDETKDDFISMASHQLRTPLTSVKGYLSMVLEGDAGKLNATQNKMLGQAFTSSQRMVYLITDLLNVSRLKTGKFVIESAPTDLSKMIQEEMSQLMDTAEAKNLTLTYHKPATFPLLMLDGVKTRQVVMNFIDNAIYYTPSGGHIDIDLLEKPSTIELRVIDDGIGVPRSEQHHLFTKFYRAANARKARPDGTGLGLFMAKKVIIAEGGSIIFSSRENKGSTFGFIFSKSRLKVPDALLPTGAAPDPAAKVPSPAA
ncbi:MAG TPA: GAF domain-containing sensor histidine kinase [Candidatus Saccharimonadales bacterium]|nr:GAF domain-containing sensor histidine kinase [Candidatus Saccharimonadales bacterium]